jgi:chromosome segregation ATPase
MEKVTSLEGQLKAVVQQNQELIGEVSKIKSGIGRVDSLENDISRQRNELTRKIEGLEKQHEKQRKEAINVLRTEIKNIDRTVDEVRKELTQFVEIKRELVIRKEGEQRLTKLIAELGTDVEEIKKNEEVLNRIYRVIEDGHRQEIKRITDLQGEIIALRKRADEHRSRLDLSDINNKKIDTRLNELITTENERKIEQAAFMEKQALAEVERERLWKDWQTRFEAIERQSIDIEEQITALDTTRLAIGRTQASVEKLSQKIERRLNEVLEVQRLGEDRFRQEWATFKADDQKRWTNYLLSQDEQRGELARHFELLAERVTLIEDQVLELQDAISYSLEQTQKRLQSIFALIHEWVSAFEKP